MSMSSAAGRVPMGPLCARLPAHWTLAGVLVVEAAINLMISRTTWPLVLTLLLIVEGIGLGVCLVSAQTAVASAAGGGNRGAAVGLFWMAGSLGDLFGPIALGVIAQELGLIAVFQTVAAAVVVGALLVAGFGAIGADRSRRAARALALGAPPSRIVRDPAGCGVAPRTAPAPGPGPATPLRPAATP